MRDNLLNTALNTVFVSSITQSPNTWTTGNVTVTVNASSGANAAMKDYSFDGGETWQTSNTKVFTNYQRDVLVIARDIKDNTCTKVIPKINIDRSAPEILSVNGNEGIYANGQATLSVEANDSGSGIKRDSIANSKANIKKSLEGKTGGLEAWMGAVGNQPGKTFRSFGTSRQRLR